MESDQKKPERFRNLSNVNSTANRLASGQYGVWISDAKHHAARILINITLTLLKLNDLMAAFRSPNGNKDLIAKAIHVSEL